MINNAFTQKDRLARECSPTYEGSLGKKRFVNEDIFNEVDKILSKYYEIIDKQKVVSNNVEIQYIAY